MPTPFPACGSEVEESGSSAKAAAIRTCVMTRREPDGERVIREQQVVWQQWNTPVDNSGRHPRLILLTDEQEGLDFYYWKRLEPGSRGLVPRPSNRRRSERQKGREP
ncbi:MAG: hypothetical protein AB1898_07645 [Acidobacteriota bacterium]